MLNPMGRLFSARKRGCNMRKIGKKLTGFMSDLNIGLFFVSIFSIMTTNFVYGATCETASTGSCSSAAHYASNCNGTPATYYIKGQNVCYSSCGSGSCNNGYTAVNRTINTGGCTFTMTDCLPDHDYAIVVTECDSSTDIYASVCNTLGVSKQGEAIINQLIKDQRLSEGYRYLYNQYNCGVYSITAPSWLSSATKVIMCFQNHISVGGSMLVVQIWLKA